MTGNKKNFIESIATFTPTARAINNFKITIAILAAATLAVTGGVWRYSNTFQNMIAKTNLDFGDGNDGATDILLVGIDSRTDAKGNPLSRSELASLRAGDAVSTNTDTIILLRIPKNNRSAVAISIPRDSYIDLPDGSKSKINAVYGMNKEAARVKAVQAGKTDRDAEAIGEKAGQQALINAVDNFMGVTIDHYAEIGLLGFILMTDAVGGVEVCLKHAVHEPLSGANFKAGKQTLTGSDALSFVRQRHDLPRGDLDRIVRQQTYMASISSEILSAKTLTNPSKLNKLKSAIERSIIIDSDWNVMDFAIKLSDLAGGDVLFVTIPIVKENGWTADGQQSIVQVNPQKVKAFVAATVAPLKSKVKVKDFNKQEYVLNISNSTRTDGLGGAVSNAFNDRGFKIGEVNNYNGFAQTKNLIITKDEDYPIVDYLKANVNNTEVKIDDTLPDKTVTLVIGSSYKGPRKAVASESPDSSNPKAITADKKEIDSNCIN